MGETMQHSASTTALRSFLPPPAACAAIHAAIMAAGSMVAASPALAPPALTRAARSCPNVAITASRPHRDKPRTFMSRTAGGVPASSAGAPGTR
jgi:hypothetical protein